MNKLIYYSAMILGIVFFMLGCYWFIHYHLLQEMRKYISLYYHKKKKEKS